MRVLITDNFRYPSGQVATGQQIHVYTRGTSTPASLTSDLSGLVSLSNPLTVDAAGNVSFYVPEGSYDYSVSGVRVPFDATVDGLALAEYTHVQTITNDTWTIIHNLGFKPNVTVEVGGEIVLADVSHADVSTAIVRFALPQLGSAYLS